MEPSKLDLHLLYKNATGFSRPKTIDTLELIERDLLTMERDNYRDNDYTLPYEIECKCLTEIQAYIYFLEQQININK